MSSFAISTPHRLATEAGAEILREGGNAIDAALVAAVVLTVVYPHNCQLGGDLIALLDRPDQPTVCVNSSGAAAGATDLATFGQGRMPSSGPLTVTVPGAIAGWWSLHRSGASLSWEEIFTEATILAREGLPVANGLARAIKEMSDVYAADPGMAAIFRPRGRALTEGDTLQQPKLARTLDALASEGPEAFYGGAVGRQLVETLSELGSPLVLEDFENHATETVAPIGRRFRDLEVLTSPPNSQGFTLLGILGALARVENRGLPISAPVMASLFGAAARDRDTLLADPAFASVPVEHLLSEDILEQRAIDAIGSPSGRPPGEFPPATGDTVAVVVTDGFGNAVSLIQSVFGSFGAGILCPKTGILLHNRGASFSLDPDSPNVIAPRKRPAHTLMPVMAFRDDGLRYVNGTMGGLGQAQIHTQLLLALDRGAEPEDAVAEPRWVLGEIEVGGDDSSVLAESRLPDSVTAQLTGAGYRVVGLEGFDEEVGHAQSIVVHANGSKAAGSDPRCDGSAVVE